MNNLLIDATITDYTIHHIATRAPAVASGGMIYLELEIKWEVLDYYKKSIFSKTTSSQSGQFAIFDYSDYGDVVSETLKDVMGSGFIEFMETPKVVELMNDKGEIERENAFEEIVMTKAKSNVTNLSGAIKSCLTIKSKDAFGSGFLVSSDGYIVTNYHVISDTNKLMVVLNDNSEHKVEIVRESKIYDLALLKITTDKKLVPFTISDSKDIEIAAEIYAVGTPSAEDLSQTISKGIVSGIRNNEGSKLIQTDASVNSGNSGGAIVTKEGLVLGVVSSKLKGFGIEGVAFGIPAYEILDRLNIKIRN